MRKRALDAFFFPTSDQLQLMGVFRGPQSASRVWVLCPPFAEEEKSTRRVLTLITQELEKRGQASLLFSFRGTGDSQGDFESATLTTWRQDLEAAVKVAQRSAPHAELALLGVRLGASLALQEAEKLGAKKLALIEPLMSGRSFLMQQNAKKQIRAQLTGTEATDSKTPVEDASFEDLDGWALGPAMKSELSALDLRKEAPAFSGQSHIFQVGPRPEMAPPLQSFADNLKGSATAVVMPAFWNLIDYADPAPLLQVLQREVWHD